MIVWKPHTESSVMCYSILFIICKYILCHTFPLWIFRYPILFIVYSHLGSDKSCFCSCQIPKKYLNFYFMHIVWPCERFRLTWFMVFERNTTGDGTVLQWLHLVESHIRLELLMKNQMHCDERVALTIRESKSLCHKKSSSSVALVIVFVGCFFCFQLDSALLFEASRTGIIRMCQCACQ